MVGACPRALRRARLAQFAAVAGCSAEVFGSTLAAALSWRERSSVRPGSIKTARNAFDSARPRARPLSRKLISSAPTFQILRDAQHVKMEPILLNTFSHSNTDGT